MEELDQSRYVNLIGLIQIFVFDKHIFIVILLVGRRRQSIPSGEGQIPLVCCLCMPMGPSYSHDQGCQGSGRRHLCDRYV